MRSLSSSIALILGGAVLAAVIAAGCSTAQGAAGAAGAAAGAASRGERFFRTKCNACHPNGGQGAGPAIDLAIAPDFLERGKSAGRHAVPEAEWEPLFGYMNAAFGGGAAVAAAVPGAAPVVGAVPVVAPTMPTPPVVPTTLASAGDAAAGGVYYQAKCAKCHPGGSKINGKPIPGVLVKGGTGKHGVDPASFDNLMAFLPSLGAVPQAPAATVAATPPPPPPTTTAVATAPVGGGDTQAGAGYYQAKCQKCHPGGSKIAGKAIPGVLVAGGSGKHGVEAAQFENLLSYLVTIGAVRAGGGPVAAGPSGTVTAPPPPPPPPPSGGGAIPNNAGMVNCSCNCQCPPGTPAEALPAACICQCSCPR